MNNCECCECDYHRRLEGLTDDACDNIAALSEENLRLRQALDLCGSFAGHPDSSAACRLVIHAVKEALESK